MFWSLAQLGRYCAFPSATEAHDLEVFAKRASTPESEETRDTEAEDTTSSVDSEESDQLQLGPKEFLVVLGEHVDHLGIEIESIRDMLCVAKMKRGPVATWNASHPSAQVQLGDRIVKVNGVEAKTPLLVEALQSGKEIRLVMRPPRQFTVSLVRPATGGEIGMCVIGGSAKFDMLKVTALRERGLVDTWNKANPDEAILPGDRVLSVNGVRGEPDKMLQELQHGSIVSMNVIRPA